MEIKDINVEVERLEEVRGGVSNLGFMFANMGGDDVQYSNVHNFGLGDVGVSQVINRPQYIGQNLSQESATSWTKQIGVYDSLIVGSVPGKALL